MEFHLKRYGLGPDESIFTQHSPWYAHAPLGPWPVKRWPKPQRPYHDVPGDNAGATATCMGKRMKVATIPMGLFHLWKLTLSVWVLLVWGKSPLPNCNGDKTSPFRRTNNSSNTTLNVLHHTVWNLKIIRHQTIPQGMKNSAACCQAKTTKQTASPTHPQSPPSHRFNPQVPTNKYFKRSGWRFSSRFWWANLRISAANGCWSTWGMESEGSSQTKTNKMREIYPFRPVSERNFGNNVVCNRIPLTRLKFLPLQTPPSTMTATYPSNIAPSTVSMWKIQQFCLWVLVLCYFKGA